MDLPKTHGEFRWIKVETFSLPNSFRLPESGISSSYIYTLDYHLCISQLLILSQSTYPVCSPALCICQPEDIGKTNQHCNKGVRSSKDQHFAPNAGAEDSSRKVRVLL